MIAVLLLSIPADASCPADIATSEPRVVVEVIEGKPLYHGMTLVEVRRLLGPSFLLQELMQGPFGFQVVLLVKPDVSSHRLYFRNGRLEEAATSLMLIRNFIP